MACELIELRKSVPHFKGNARLVFVHPDNPDLLIKVLRPEWIAKTKEIPEWKKRFKPLGANSVNMHELYEIVRVNPSAKAMQPHLFSVVGFQQTDLGWGLVVKAEKDEQNNYARPLSSFAKNVDMIRAALDDFEQWIKTTNVVLYDLNPWNLVLAHRGGKQEIVIIDGIAEKSALKMRTYFPSINTKKNMKVYARFLRFMERIKNETD